METTATTETEVPATGITARIVRRCVNGLRCVNAAAEEDQRKRQCNNKCFAHFYLLKVQIVILLYATTIENSIQKLLRKNVKAVSVHVNDQKIKYLVLL